MLSFPLDLTLSDLFSCRKDAESLHSSQASGHRPVHSQMDQYKWCFCVIVKYIKSNADFYFHYVAIQ